MMLSNVMSRECVVFELNSKVKTEVLDELSSILANHVAELSREDVLSAILEREKLGSTGIGYGVAIPHGKVEGVSKVHMAFGRSSTGVDFDSMDDKPAHLFFLIVAPADANSEHLKTLSAISTMLKEEDFRAKLLKAKDGDEIYDILMAENI